MADIPPSDSKPPMGGGAPLALLMLAGVIIGGFLGQPTIGLLVGFALGALVAVLIWRMGSR